MRRTGALAGIVLWRGMPQQTSAPAASAAHVVFVPAARVAKTPAGGDDCPAPLPPQHAAVPSSRNPQVCASPAATAANSSGGGLDCPESSLPQQTARPVPRSTAQAWFAPTESPSATRSLGGCARPSAFEPQQVTLPSRSA